MGLTVKEIDSAKPSGKPYKLADRAGCVCSSHHPARNYGAGAIASMARKKMMALGEYPLVTLNQARELHFAVRKTLAAGIDPMAERKAEADLVQYPETPGPTQGDVGSGYTLFAPSSTASAIVKTCP